MPYVTIDPGLAGTGWACWSDRWRLLGHGVIPAPARSWNKYTSREEKIAYALVEAVAKYKPTKAFIEYPAKFGGVKGDMVANRGDLVKLACLFGYLKAKLAAAGVRTEAVEVCKWKGQLPKDIVIKRIKRLLPKCAATSHDWDAVGIGLYVKGVF